MHHDVFILPQPEVVSFKHTKEGTIEVIKRVRSNMSYGNGQPYPDKVTKEIYGCSEGKVVLLSETTGTHKPAYRVAEQITFS